MRGGHGPGSVGGAAARQIMPKCKFPSLFFLRKFITVTCLGLGDGFDGVCANMWHVWQLAPVYAVCVPPMPTSHLHHLEDEPLIQTSRCRDGGARHTART